MFFYSCDFGICSLYFIVFSIWHSRSHFFSSLLINFFFPSTLVGKIRKTQRPTMIQISTKNTSKQRIFFLVHLRLWIVMWIFFSVRYKISINFYILFLSLFFRFPILSCRIDTHRYFIFFFLLNTLLSFLFLWCSFVAILFSSGFCLPCFSWYSTPFFSFFIYQVMSVRIRKWQTMRRWGYRWK